MKEHRVINDTQNTVFELLHFFLYKEYENLKFKIVKFSLTRLVCFYNTPNTRGHLMIIGIVNCPQYSKYKKIYRLLYGI